MKVTNSVVYLSKAIDKQSVPDIMQQLQNTPEKEIDSFDLKEVSSIDSAGVVFLDYLTSRFPQANLNNVPSHIQHTVDTFHLNTIDSATEPPKTGFFENIGDQLFKNLENSKQVMYLLADILYWSIVGLFNKKGQRKDSVIQQTLLIGMDAIPIIALLSFILGLILALQSAAQLHQFGADIYLADLISITMITEMGPILTAIMVSGRSGSAIASEIATMTVTEEIDALKMMALNPIRFVVVPKFHAMTICMPLLVTLSMFVGVLGGALIGFYYLDIAPGLFWSRVFAIATLRDFVIAIGKSIVFSWVIVIIGVYYGLNVKGGAEGVGKVTTASVVASIFWIIVLDAVNSLIFYYN